MAVSPMECGQEPRPGLGSRGETGAAGLSAAQTLWLKCLELELGARGSWELYTAACSVGSSAGATA